MFIVPFGNVGLPGVKPLAENGIDFRQAGFITDLSGWVRWPAPIDCAARSGEQRPNAPSALDGTFFASSA